MSIRYTAVCCDVVTSVLKKMVDIRYYLQTFTTFTSLRGHPFHLPDYHTDVHKNRSSFDLINILKIV